MKLFDKLSNFQEGKANVLYDEIVGRLSGDTSNDKIRTVCFDILDKKIKLANTYRRKGKINLMENEIFLANTIIHSIFAPEHSIIISNDEFGLSGRRIKNNWEKL